MGYETLCKEVADWLAWRRFCRIALEARVPEPTRLMKLTKRLGPELLEELNAELLSLAVERKVLRSRRLRVDTTVVESDTRHPTDSGLCAHAVSRLTRLVRRVQRQVWLSGHGCATGAARSASGCGQSRQRVSATVRHCGRSTG